MDNYIKKNINTILGIFILISPIIDLLTGIGINQLKMNLTIGTIVRLVFLISICLIVIFIFKKKKIIIPYLIIGIYFILYLVGILIYKDGANLIFEMQGLVKTFYFPILFLSFYYIKDSIHISKLLLFTSLFIYILFIFIPILFNVGYKSYDITKSGTIGYFNTANEISGIISILTPIMFIILASGRKIILKIIFIIMYLTVILTIGTKTPLITFLITIGLSIAYLWIILIKEKKYFNILISLLVLIIGVSGLLIITPRTNFYKNIETHLDFLELDRVRDVFQDKKLVDHFIFSQRLTFLKKKAHIYKQSSTYEKIFGIGYINNNKTTKLIEMDYFDIFYSHGIVGFLIYFIVVLILLYKILEYRGKHTYERYMLQTSLIFIVLTSFFTGHIITSPTVSLFVIVILLSLTKNKKRLLFVDENLNNKLISIFNNIDYSKNEVTLILKENNKSINEHIIIKEISTNSIFKDLVFKIFNYHNYDFSCFCGKENNKYADYVKIASINNSYLVSIDYNKRNYITKLFNNIKINEYNKILVTSNDTKKIILKEHPDLEDKLVFIETVI